MFSLTITLYRVYRAYSYISESMEEDPQLFQQFKGHKDAITASHFSPNGKQVNNVSPTISAIVIFLHMKANRDIIDGSMIKDLWHNTIGIIILRFMLC